MDLSSTDEPQRRTRRRTSDSHYSAFSITAATPAIAQRMSTKVRSEGGQNYKQAIDTKDCRSEVMLPQDDKTQGRRHSLGAYNQSLQSPRLGTLPVPYGVTSRRHSEVISPLSFRVLRQENEPQINQRRGQLNRAKSEDNDRPQNTASLALKVRKHGLLLKPSVRSGAGAGETLKLRTNPEKSPKGLRKGLNQKPNPKTNQLNVEEKRSELDRRIKIFNQNMDKFNQADATKCRKISLEKPSNTIVKADIPRSMSLPVVFQSYSDLNFQRLSPSEKNSFASLRHCRYLRIPAPPELTIKEIFQHHNKKERVDKGTKFPRK